ncbi:hypothetical protein [Butyrivibrio sp. VCB2001]|uniref:hypothetical protein n=1 Tax=Butyrivibrio sp. VCB2001 TaxID=1280667 RepID=UPI0004067AF4|nr:hypothetical protein [Butyrivibrio sp. VCB2001]
MANKGKKRQKNKSLAAKSFLKDDPAFDGMTKEVMAVYDSMTEEERARAELDTAAQQDLQNTFTRLGLEGIILKI